jgi:hypothetical protein
MAGASRVAAAAVAERRRVEASFMAFSPGTVA